MDEQSRVVAEIRSALASMAVGDRLPSERAMALRYEVSRASIKRAILQLISEGYLEHQPGHCPRVSAQDRLPLALERLIELEPSLQVDLTQFVEKLSHSVSGSYPASIAELLQRLKVLSQRR